MPARLDEHTFACIDQDDGKVCGRRAGKHVTRILLMPGAIGDDELPLLSGEKAIGYVDGDTLLALGSQSVDQKRKVDFLPLRTDPFAVALQRFELVFEDHLGIV